MTLRALYADIALPLEVCKSAATDNGVCYYIGRLVPDGDMKGAPYARDSVRYWPTEKEAKDALKTGLFEMREHP